MEQLLHFKKVFNVIKKHCQDNNGNVLDGNKCMELVNGTLDKDEHYEIGHLIDHLQILQNMGLIYVKRGDPIEITITDLGKKTNRIPSSS